MLTQADDFPIHQTPEPIALGSSDRNFYDRYFFNGHTPDGAIFFAVAFGMYPNLNIADAHFSVVVDSVQHCLHTSRHLHSERLDLRIGPISIEVLEPLRKLRVKVQPAEGISAELVFLGRSFPIHEPRFTHRFGTRAFMDLTRLTQNCQVTGWIEVDGKRIQISDGSQGVRDRSWGIRPIGAPDTQPFSPPFKPSVFWLWTPAHFPDRSLYFHVMAEGSGRAWNSRAVICPDGAGPEQTSQATDPKYDLDLIPGLRHPQRGRVSFDIDGRKYELVLHPRNRRLHMKGIGYSHPTWAHGTYKGELVVEREDIYHEALDLTQPENLHVQVLADATLNIDGAEDDHGIAVFEYSIRGSFSPLQLS